MAKVVRFVPRCRRDPVLVRIFRESRHSYEAGVQWLIAKFEDSFAQEPVGAAPRRVTYRAGTLERLDPLEEPSAETALAASPVAK